MVEVLRVEEKKSLTLLELKREEERGFFVSFGMKKGEGLYSSGGGNMNGKIFNEG